jgi:hypothetical protein
MQQARNILLPIILVSGCLFCSSGSYGAEGTRNSYASEIVRDVREDKVYLLENIRHKVTKPSEKTLVDALLSEDGPKAASLYRKQLSEYPDPQLDDISRSRLAAYDRTMTATAKPVTISQKPAAPTSAISSPASAAKRPDTVSRQVAAPVAARPAAPAPAATAPAATAPPASVTARKPDTVEKQPKAPAAKPASATDSPSASTARVTLPAAPKPASGGGAFTLQFGSFDSVANAEQLAAQLSSSSPAKVVEVNGVYKVRLRKTFATREEASVFRRTLPYESFVVTDQP